ncbi:MAG TPA: oligopeptide/dipeptide ABC transporter ATP-binding protein, partial [Candidatus Bathyarchaeia archaeon]|nr:oligopeptide/dipeptide ABC transporter ATP-binding protein [Candidatus Bathyarchaeia archaeon]
KLLSIPGQPPDLLNPPTGCRFHPRCPYVMDICKKENPQLKKQGTGEHYVACHLY